MKSFDGTRASLREQYKNIPWLRESGLTEDALRSACEQLREENPEENHALLKAQIFALICEQGRIAIDPEDLFQEKLQGRGILTRLRSLWEKEIVDAKLSAVQAEMEYAWETCGAYKGFGDYGHCSPDSSALLELGFPGLLSRMEQYARREGLTRKQLDFYESCRIMLRACIRVLQRLSEASAGVNPESAAVLQALTCRPPETFREALQLMVVYFYLHEYIGGTRIRTLGRLDAMLEPYYRRDLALGRYSREEMLEMLKFFLNKFWVMDVPFGLPFCIGGTDRNGREITNDVSRLIVEAYTCVNVHSPKIHVRISDKTPPDFLKQILRAIRDGFSSFVFIGDETGIESLRRVGIEEEDARDFTPIGCYEPAVWGKEIGCTGNGRVNLPKAVELVCCGGQDHATGLRLIPAPGVIGSFGDFTAAVKDAICFMTERSMDFIRGIEPYYGVINPDPLLSVQYRESVVQGLDVYDNGAKYNNSSLKFMGIATLIDAMMAVKALVFDEKAVTFPELCGILRDNWQTSPKLRLRAKRLPCKYGNGDRETDALSREMADFCASLVNGKANARGGVFKAALFSIDTCFVGGSRTMATPDGRLAGDPVSKNLCASIGADKKGVTALIRSVTAMDHAAFPNGSVLDVVLHPSAVSGEDGLEAFYGMVKTYFSLGGFALHGNVFDADTLRAARDDPETYANLQVRVCGWNAYFVNLTPPEQEAFIRQAELCQ